MKILVRPKEAMRRLGLGHSKFWQDYVRPGRLRPVRLGKRSVAFPEAELDQLITELEAERDILGPAPRRVRLGKVA